MPYRLIIAGGRDFYDLSLVQKEMKNFDHKDLIIITGKAKGADGLGEFYARDKGLKVVEFNALWGVYGKIAGSIRNEEMAKNADGCLCFWDGKSKGTENMIITAKKYKLDLWVVNYNNQE